MSDAKEWIRSLSRPVEVRAARLELAGRIAEARGVVVRVVGVSLRVGEMVRLTRPGGDEEQFGEVVGFAHDGALVMPLGGVEGLSTITQVEGCGLAWGRIDPQAALGRVLDGLGRPLDGGPALTQHRTLTRNRSINPLERPVIAEPFVTGVRAIDALMSCGVGQRVGIFAQAGGGKSSLLGMIANAAHADAVVIALVGERGREVAEFIHDHLRERRDSTAVIAATSDRPAAERLKAAEIACDVAAGLREEGRRVVLLFDSLTRHARALREVGLAVGEPAVRRGYPPRVFSELPRLIESAGLTRRGSVTAFFTVLAEDEDFSDPIVEEAHSLLDARIQLSNRLGGAGHYPAIDVLNSKSRVMTRVADAQHRAWATQVRAWLARYQELELLVQIGEYRRGNDAQSDRAIDRQPAIMRFLRQRTDELSGWRDTLAGLRALCEGA